MKMKILFLYIRRVPNVYRKYNPVTLTSAVCKIIEKLVHKHVVKRRKKNDSNEYGFRKNEPVKLSCLEL